MSKLIYQYYCPDGLKKRRRVTNSSCLVIKEAEKYGLQWQIIPGTPIVTLTYKGQTKSYYYQIPSTTTALGQYACNNKKIASNLLRKAGISVPHGYRISRTAVKKDWLKVFNALKKPLVVKPTHGTWGKNITVHVTDKQQYLQAVELALAYPGKRHTGAIVEEMFQGQEYRILLTREKVIGIVKRVSANVVGNGQDSIKKLIKQKNQQEIRDVKGGGKSHIKIRMDKKLKKFLTAQKLSLTSIPKKDQQVFLRRVSNISQGGDAIDVTDLVHSSVKKIALQAIRAIPGLAFTGLDFMTKDVTKKQNPDSYVVIEINDSPGFDIHDYPYQGKNRHAAREFLFLIFPELKKAKPPDF
ncbi:MAG: hypothetical protein GF390_00475 [Candidatus Pacebacteria bacterium]|nr:hypothetical protein [Candidatus Paceibacterota bacterium]